MHQISSLYSEQFKIPANSRGLGSEVQGGINHCRCHDPSGVSWGMGQKWGGTTSTTAVGMLNCTVVKNPKQTWSCDSALGLEKL